jgi:crotonobetainyl-CoA:carnitine CoA-transferase CaiB-like acyl-CoA transferase
LQVLTRLESADVPSGPIYSVEDMATDPQYEARGMLEQVSVGGRPLRVPALCPVLTHGRGRTEWAGPELGEHTREVLEGLLAMPAERVDALIASGAVAQYSPKGRV